LGKKGSENPSKNWGNNWVSTKNSMEEPENIKKALLPENMNQYEWSKSQKLARKNRPEEI